jgi:hypothetical protein
MCQRSLEGNLKNTLYRMKMKIKYAEICKTAKDMVRGKTMSI